MSETKQKVRGFCSKCGGPLTGGKPCAGGSKVMRPVDVQARSLATAFVMSHKQSFGNVSDAEIDGAVSKVTRALYEVMRHSA